MDTTHIHQKRPVCVIHTGSDELFFFHRLQDYGMSVSSRFSFNEIVDELQPLSGSELEARQDGVFERFSREEYVILLVGQRTGQMRGRGVQALSVALYMKRPVIVVNLDGNRSWDPQKVPSLLEERLVLCVGPDVPVLEHALETWRDESFRLHTMGREGAVVYGSDLYDALVPASSGELPSGRANSLAL